MTSLWGFCTTRRVIFNSGARKQKARSIDCRGGKQTQLKTLALSDATRRLLIKNEINAHGLHARWSAPPDNCQMIISQSTILTLGAHSLKREWFSKSSFFLKPSSPVLWIRCLHFVSYWVLHFILCNNSAALLGEKLLQLTFISHPYPTVIAMIEWHSAGWLCSCRSILQSPLGLAPWCIISICRLSTELKVKMKVASRQVSPLYCVGKYTGDLLEHL